MIDLSTRMESAGSVWGEASIPLDGIEATIWTSDSPPLSGGVLEMSPRDLKLQVQGAVKSGSIVELELTSPRDAFHFSVRGQIHWKQEIGRHCLAGVFLHRALPHDVVGHFWSDLRKELRYACDWACLLRNRRRRIPAELLNYSRSGVLIACDSPLAQDDEIEILDVAQPDASPIVTGVIRWQSRHANQHLLGCELPDEQGMRLSAYLRSAGCW